jgi:hypothetical protein
MRRICSGAHMGLRAAAALDRDGENERQVGDAAIVVAADGPFKNFPTAGPALLSAALRPAVRGVERRFSTGLWLISADGEKNEREK